MSFDPLLDRHDAVLNAIRDATDAIVKAIADAATMLKPLPPVAHEPPKAEIYHEPAPFVAPKPLGEGGKPLPDLAEPHPAPVASTPVTPLQNVPAKPLPEFGESQPAQDVPGARPLALTDL